MSKSRGTRRAKRAPGTSRREKSPRPTDRKSGSAAAAGSRPAEKTGRPRSAPTLLFGTVSEPAKERAEVGSRGAIFNRRDVLDHLFVRGRTVRHRAIEKIELRTKNDDRWCLAVDVDDVADVEAGAIFPARRLPQLALNSFEVDRQPADVDR